MKTLIKRDIQLSFLVGFIAGLLMLPTLNNIGLLPNFYVGTLIVIGLTLFTPLGYLMAYWLSGFFPVLIQFVKFGIVGGLNAMLDLGILNLLIRFTGITAGVYFSVFKAASFAIAVTNSYFWNKYWTFHADDGPRPAEFIKFLIVNFVGLAINVAAASLVVNFIAAPAGVSPELWANIGAISAVFISLFLNFLGMKFIVFKR